MTKDKLDSLRAMAADAHVKYIEAEKNLWDNQGLFKNKESYKAYKKAKADFWNAINSWENAILELVINSEK